MPGNLPSLVINYLESLKNQGVEHLPVDEEACQILRGWMISARGGAPSSPPSREGAQKKITPDTGLAASAPAEHETDDSAYIPGSIKIAEVLADDSHKETEDKEEVPEIGVLQGDTLEERLLNLCLLAQNWIPAKSLGTLRDTLVFASGSPHSNLMLIGEAPGYHEELARLPFVGRAGEKLTGILNAMGIDRKSSYISNIVKFRPSMPRQTTNNRPPTETEIASCMPIISAEIDIVQPDVIIALGATAARGLLGTGPTPLSALRGRFHQFKGIPVRVTYHPSYLLRTEELSERRKVWEDMLAVMELLKMPISDKQRGYFLPKN